MPKRVHIALAVLLVTLAGACVWQGLRSRGLNPIVDGTPLASWLDYYVRRQSEVQRDMANQALDKMGTDAIPTLLWMLRQRDSSFKQKLMELVQKQHFITVHSIPAERQNRAAYIAFQRMGAHAEAAVPALIEIYQLQLSHSSQQCTAGSLSELGPAARMAIPVLARGTTNANPSVRGDTLLALAHFHAEPELVVPALTHSLSDPNVRVRQFACTALYVLGRGGRADVAKVGNPSREWVRQAVPALVQSLSDSDPAVIDSAARALKTIDPEAAAKAGVK